MTEPVFLLLIFDIGLIGQIIIDFLLADRDFVIHLPFAQFIDDHFIFDVFTEIGKSHAVAGQHLTELLHIELVVFGDIFNHPVDGFVVNPNTGAFGDL